MDGGAMFGPVPKMLWSKKCVADEANLIALANNVMLVQTGTNNILIDTGIGNKLTPKQQKIFQILSPWMLVEDLLSHGLSRDDIDTVIVTHGDFDHAGGMLMSDADGQIVSTFPQARYVIQRDEWHDMRHPNKRSASSYWPLNFTGLNDEQLVQVEGQLEIVPGVRVFWSGGHTRGHQIVELQSEGEYAVHLGDLFPMTHHTNPLWVMSYDNHPLDVIEAKERFFQQYIDTNAWFLLYHDPNYFACRLSHEYELMELL